MTAQGRKINQKITYSLLIAIALTLLSSHAFSQEKVRLRVITSLGNFTLQLYPEKAPETVTNILKYVDSGFYSDVIFHRVIKDFMVQAGGFTKKLARVKPKYPPIQNEAFNGLKNLRGTLAMARSSNPHSASTQFFINTKDNPHLDFVDKSPKGWGYTVFGKIVSGMHVIRRIERKPTSKNNFPIKSIVIKRITRI